METYQVELTKSNVPDFLSLMSKIKVKVHKVDDLQEKYKGRISDGDDSIDFMKFVGKWKNSKIDAKKLRSCKRDYTW